MFSTRAQWNFETNRISQKISGMKSRILDLTESNPARAGIRYPKEILKAFGQKQNLNYKPDSKGLLSARKTIAQYYSQKGIRITPDQIILTASTSEGYSHLFRLLANPGDEVLVPQPSYPLFDYLAGLSDVRLKPYSLNYETKWHIDFESLKNNITPKTRAVMLVNPNNPTGNFVKREESARLNEIAKQNHLALISDEVFLDYSFPLLRSGRGGREAPGEGREFKETLSPALSLERERNISLAGNQNALTFTLSGISKILALPQMKLGWIVVSGPKKVRDEAIERLEVIADTFLSVSTPVQNAVGAWFKQKSKIQNQILDRVKKNLKTIQLPASCELLHAEGGWYAVIRVPRIHSEEEWVMQFLEKDKVLVQPGYFFDFPKEAYIVVSLLTPEKNFKEGIKRIQKRIEHE